MLLGGVMLQDTVLKCRTALMVISTIDLLRAQALREEEIMDTMPNLLTNKDMAQLLEQPTNHMEDLDLLELLLLDQLPQLVIQIF